MAPRMPFDYYHRLSRAQRATYDRSDAITEVPLPSVDLLRPLVEQVVGALAADQRREVERGLQALADALLDQLAVPRLLVKVKAVRPSAHWGELHGLYEVLEDGSEPRLTVWMRTVAHRRTVAPRTFVRTVVHELCHHLDGTLHGLAETFHTEGFFKRESSLVNQVLGPSSRGRKVRDS
ncbi:MAG: hypothetical protein ABIJ09_20955 [Pseudomonadota bacterium]